jgi:hypothetical protein
MSNAASASISSLAARLQNELHKTFTELESVNSLTSSVEAYLRRDWIIDAVTQHKYTGTTHQTLEVEIMMDTWSFHERDTIHKLLLTMAEDERPHFYCPTSYTAVNPRYNTALLHVYCYTKKTHDVPLVDRVLGMVLGGDEGKYICNYTFTHWVYKLTPRHADDLLYLGV